MSDIIESIVDVVPDVTKAIDSGVESEEERQATLTDRLRIDTTSKFILPHIVRPIIALSLLLMQIALLVAMFLGIEVPTNVVIEVGSLLGIAIGFYFNSRKAEKLNAKKVQAAIEIQESKERMNIKREELELKQSKKDARRERRQSK